MTQPKVVIILVNWNRREDTLECLRSLTAIDYANAQCLVVDNGSEDGSVAAVRAEFPGVQVIEAGENLGFVLGNNLGLAFARRQNADYALLLNNDTLVAPDFLTRLVQAGEADQQVGVVGPTIYYASQPEVIWSAGGAIDWEKGQSSMLGLNELDRGLSAGAAHEVDFVTGCALAVKLAAVAAAGELDARFFAYYEETEWCVRIRRAGYRILHVPGARIWHKISPEVRADSPSVHYYMTRNRLLFLKLARAGWQAWLNALLVDDLRTLASWSLRPKWRGKAELRRVMWQGIGDYFTGKFGRMAA